MQTLGRWSLNSYTRYIRTTLQVKKDANGKLGFKKPGILFCFRFFSMHMCIYLLLWLIL